MKAIVSRVVRSATQPGDRFGDRHLDGPDLERRYGLEIPVLMLNGRKVAKYRVTEAELRRRWQQ